MLRLIALVIFTLALTQTAWAQRDPRTRNRLPDYLRYLNSSDVREDLGLSAEQITKLRELSGQYSEKTRPTTADLRQLSPDERGQRLNERQEKVEAVGREYMPQLQELLTAEQMQRLKQIDYQFFAGGAVFQDEVAKTLRLTPEQQTKVDELYKSLSVSLAERSAEERRKLRDKSISEILTAEQNKQFAQLQGKPFDVAKLQSTPPAGPFQERAGTFPRALSKVSLFANPAVQKELALSESQQTKFNELTKAAQEKTRTAMTSVFNAIRDQSPEERSRRLSALRGEITEKMGAVENEYVPQLMAVLTPEQSERMLQIRWQAAGDEALLDSELVRQLKLSPEQEAKLASVAKEAADKLAALAPAELRSQTGEINAARNAALLEVLTVEQREQLTSLKGKPFDLAALRVPGSFGGPFGGGTFAFRPIPGSVTGVNAFLHAAVLQDLGLTEDQQAKISELTTRWNGDTRLRLDELRDLSSEERRKRLAEISTKRREAESEYLPQLNAVLNAEQIQRLQQIRWQAAGDAALVDEELTKQLNLSAEQQTQFKQIIQETSEKQAAIRPDERGLLTREQAQQRTTLNAARDKALREILTAEQQEQLAKLKGKEFDFTAVRNRTFGGFTRPQD